MPVKQPKLNPAERRSVPREVLAQQPQGTLQLHIGDRCIDVVWIRDISPVGICLQLDAAVDKGAQVQLKYTADGIQIEVLGTVAWAKAVKSPHPNNLDALGWWAGIFLHPSCTEANFALYRTMMEGRNDWLCDELGKAFYW